MSVQRGWATDFCAKTQISAQQFGNLGGLCSQLVERTIASWQRKCAPTRIREMFATQVGVSRRTDRRVLRGERTATEQVTRPLKLCVAGDAFPEHAENDKITVFVMNARASKFH